MKDTHISYAQNREDLILNAFFKESEKGFYVDVGANHPVHESVTKLFYDKGWRGMNVEPTTWLYRLLCVNRPRDINVQVGVSDKEGSMRFREYPKGDGLSTFSAEMQKMYEKNDYFYAQDYKEYDVPIQTLAHIFAAHKVASIDFMKVDIEGYEYEALIGNDWKKYRPKVLCIEANHIVRDWHKLIKEVGYTLAFFDGLNEYFVANEESQRLKEFSYPDKILLAPLYISWREQQARQDAAVERSLLAYELESMQAVVEGFQKQANNEEHVHKLPRLRRGVRRVDNKVEALLSSGNVHHKPHDTLDAGSSAANYIAELRNQVIQSAPSSERTKKLLRYGYGRTKHLVKKAVKGIRT